MSRSGTTLLAGLLLVAVAAGCASVSDAATNRALDDLSPSTTVAPAPTSTEPSHCDEQGFPVTASFPWQGPFPAPGEMPAGSRMREIQERGTLRVGVDENTPYFSYWDPDDRQFRGFEPDLARSIAEALFGDADESRITFVPVVTRNKVSAVEDGGVDMTISVVSKTCGRWDHVDFSSTYYETTQGLLVPRESVIEGLTDLDGRRVCVTEGSSSEDLVRDLTTADVVPVEARTDCLVAMQERRVDAVVLPRSILAGLATLDPTNRVLDAELSPDEQAYGIAIQKDDGAELVRFVNELLERWLLDGTLRTLQDEHLRPELRTTPAAPLPEYREP